MIGYIHPGASASFGIRPEFMASVLSVLHDEGTFSLIGGISEVSAGAVVPLARDVLTLRFLASGCDWLWCVDTDMVFTPGVLAGLWVSADEEKAPVVSAVCPVQDAGRVWPSAYRLGDEMNGAGELVIERLDTLPEMEGLVQVAACGAACVLIHRGVFDAISRAEEWGTLGRWWQPIETAQAVLGEDVSFCLRAAASGVPVHVNTNVTTGHVKAVMIGEPSPK